MTGFCVERSLKCDIAVGKHGVRVPRKFFTSCTQVSAVVRTDIAQSLPVIFGMNEDFVIECGMKIEDGGEDFVFYLDETESLVNRRFGFSRYNGDGIPDKANVGV